MTDIQQSGDRPNAPLPKGSAAGLVSVLLLSSGLPVLSLMAATGWSSRGIDLELDVLPWAAGMPMLVTVIPAFGLAGRRLWSISWYWALGALAAVVYPMALIFSALIPLGLVEQRSHEMPYAVNYPFGCLLAISPLYWFLLRFLRLRYWRPWTDRSTWEPGDEVAPEWAKRVTGIMSPSARAHWKAEKARAEKKTVVRKPRVRRPPKRRR